MKNWKNPRRAFRVAAVSVTYGVFGCLAGLLLAVAASHAHFFATVGGVLGVLFGTLIELRLD